MNHLIRQEINIYLIWHNEAHIHIYMFWLTFRFCFMSTCTLLPYVSSGIRHTQIRNENVTWWWCDLLNIGQWQWTSFISFLAFKCRASWPISPVFLVLPFKTWRDWLPRTLGSLLGFSRQRRWLRDYIHFSVYVCAGFLGSQELCSGHSVFLVILWLPLSSLFERGWSQSSIVETMLYLNFSEWCPNVLLS